jgi:hypothetical protein
MSTFGYLDIWIFGYLESWTFGHLDIWTFGPLEIWRFGDLEIWRFGHVDIWTFGHLDSWTFGHLDIWTVDGMGDEYEDDHAEDEDPPPEGANEDEGSDVEAQEMTVGMDPCHSAIALVRLDDRRSEARRFAGTVVGEVGESCANDESDDDDDDDESENDPHRPRNQHVDDEADHD